MKIGIARLWHEANSFSAALAGRAEFEAREWLRGSDAATFYKGSETEIGGALAWQAQRGDVEFAFSRCASAGPSGPVEQPFLDAFIGEVVNDPVFDDADALYLSLHGATIGTTDPDPEATLVTGLRRRFPGLPIAASFDMHACLSQELAAALDVATVYRHYPHIDMAATARTALDLLARLVETGRRGHVRLVTIGRVLPSFNMRTDGGGPMAEVEDIARALEARQAGEPGFLAVYPYASFAYADLAITDSGAIASSDDPERAELAATAIAQELERRRRAFRPELAPAEAVLAARPWCDGTRIAILEPSDNPLSGGLGDTPGLFAAACREALPEGTVFAFFCDPGLVARARAAGIGARFAASLGGRLDDRFGAPVAVEAEVLRLTDGKFLNADPMEQGMPVSLGDTAVLKVGPMRVIVTTGCQSPNDINYFRSHGIELETVPLLLAKAKNHFMAAFGTRFDRIVPCDTPGPAMADVGRLPFRQVPAERMDLERP